MTPTPIKLLGLAALVAAAGCSKKAPETLPPAPPATTTTTETTGETTGPVGTTDPGAGTRAAFIRAAGSDRVLFATDSSDLDADARATLDAQAQWLSSNASVRVTVEGHADERGTREYNLALGERRANAAKNHLVGAGVSPDRISVISYGKEQPVAAGSDEESWAQNRRAVTVVPQ